MPSSIYRKEVILNATPITAGNDILTEPIDITRDDTKPGGGVLLRIAFSGVFSAADAQLEVWNNNNLAGEMIPTSGESMLKDDTAYTFLIVAEEPDEVNFRSNRNITDVKILRVHMLQNT